MRPVWSWERYRFWNRPFGIPARSIAIWKRSPASTVCGMLEQHRIAGHERRHDGVDGGEIGIVPGRDDEHEADGLALDHAAEARLLVIGRYGLEALLRDRDHVARP